MTSKLSKHDQEALTRGTTYENTVNATARSAGAVGARALVPRKVRELTGNVVSKDFTILDYGSGPKALHTLGLRADGYDNVVAHELGENRTSAHDPDALTRTYKVVMASNVLNVQPTKLDLARVVFELRLATKVGGLLVCNFPASPRKCADVSTHDVHMLLASLFDDVTRIGGTGSAPVWMCR